MAKTIEADCTILGGLPVIAVGRVYPPEPDVGIFTNQADLDDLQWPTGHSIPTHMWERISQDDLDACLEALVEASYE